MPVSSLPSDDATLNESSKGRSSSHFSFFIPEICLRIRLESADAYPYLVFRCYTNWVWSSFFFFFLSQRTVDN